MTNPLALIIEDDKNQAHLFTETLQLAEFETEIIQDGKAAVARLAETLPDLVVLDLHLPYISGKDILHLIRTDGRLTGVRVILVTADASLAENLWEDADLVLLKPVSIYQLRNLAARLRPPDTVLD